MLRKLLPIVALLASMQAPAALAHGSGHGPVSETQARAIAAHAAGQFATFDSGLGFGILPASWKNIDPASVRTATKGDGYYIVSVENAAEGKTLYILMSDAGAVFDANFTGKFPKVK